MARRRREAARTAAEFDAIEGSGKKEVEVDEEVEASASPRIVARQSSKGRGGAL